MDKNDCCKILLDVWSSSKLSATETTVRLLLEYFQLILYLRSQIPEPVQLIQRKLQSKKCSLLPSSNCPKPKRSDVQYGNKCLQLLKDLEDLKSSIHRLVQQSNQLEAVIAIGSTPVTIKEAFTFHVNINDELESGEAFDAENVSSHARKFCMLMVQSPLCTGSNHPPTNTRLFLRAKNLTAVEGCRPWPHLKWSSKKHLLSAQLNFHSFTPTDSNTTSVNDSKLQNKENTLAVKHGEHIEHSTTWSDLDNNEARDRPIKKQPFCKLLSAAEAVEVLISQEEDDAVSPIDSKSLNSVDSTSDTPGVWLELPIFIKGFKL